MKDPVSVLGCWRGFHFGSTASTQLAKPLNRCFTFSPAQAARSSDRLRVCIGLDGFVRSYAIVFINQVSPIRRRGVLPSPRQRAGGMEPAEGGHAGTEWNQRAGGRKRTETIEP